MGQTLTSSGPECLEGSYRDDAAGNGTRRGWWPAARTVLAALLVLPQAAPAVAQNRQSVTIENCYLRVLQQAQVPALDRGVLRSLDVREGDVVRQGQVLAVLDDEEARIGVEVARLELLALQRRHDDSVDVEIATAALEEARQKLEQARISSQVAEQQAATDTAVRQAIKSRDAAQADLDRAAAAREEFRPSVSDAELERLQLLRDSGELQVEKAEEERQIAGIRTGIEAATIQQQQSAVQRLTYELQQAESAARVADLAIATKQQQRALAEQLLARRQISAPLNGMIVEQRKYPGEWVEPGETVFRIVRPDRLLVEGHAPASRVDVSARGRTVQVSAQDSGQTVTAEGIVTFVSLEVDPVNQQVQVKAEIDNTRLQLRPGQPVVMTILPAVQDSAGR